MRCMRILQRLLDRTDGGTWHTLSYQQVNHRASVTFTQSSPKDYPKHSTVHRSCWIGCKVLIQRDILEGQLATQRSKLSIVADRVHKQLS